MHKQPRAGRGGPSDNNTTAVGEGRPRGHAGAGNINNVYTGDRNDNANQARSAGLRSQSTHVRRINNVSDDDFGILEMREDPSSGTRYAVPLGQSISRSLTRAPRSLLVLNKSVSRSRRSLTWAGLAAAHNAETQCPKTLAPSPSRPPIPGARIYWSMPMADSAIR